MITFTNVRWKNLLSTGNAWTEISLIKNRSTLIVGENGAGKSSMLDAISFALYGKAFRKINKPQLINSINKSGLVVELGFKIGKSEYLVRRGIKPNVFEIYKNDKLINQDSATRDYQKYLEDNILKMNFKSFGQIVVLGSTSYVPFMALPAAGRREVVEDILDINIFTTMSHILKERVIENKEARIDNKHSLELEVERLNYAVKHNESLSKIHEDEVKRIKSKINEQVTFVEEEQGKVKALESNIEKLKKSIAHKDKVTSLIEVSNGEIRDLENQKKEAVKNLKFYENHKSCPKCNQEIEEEFKNGLIEENWHIADVEIPQEIARVLGVLNEYEDAMKDIESKEDEISKLSLDVGSHNANIRMAMNNLKSLKVELTNANKTGELIDLTSLKKSIKGKESIDEQLSNERELLSIATTMLKDGGIKSRIIKQYVPVMNTLINKYLATMDFFVDFQLDESFNETIKSRFRDIFSYGSFSEGEKLRIDLALLFTWRSVARLRNSVSTNLLIMDEIMDSSLDSNGTEEFLKILGGLTNDANSFIISHKGDQLVDKFDHVIQFEKHKGFSRMVMNSE